jgi:hypothetical protein
VVVVPVEGGTFRLRPDSAARHHRDMAFFEHSLKTVSQWQFVVSEVVPWDPDVIESFVTIEIHRF